MRASVLARLLCTMALAVAVMLPGCTTQTPDPEPKTTQVPVSKPDAPQAEPQTPKSAAESADAEAPKPTEIAGDSAPKPVDPAATVVSKPDLPRPSPLRRPNPSSNMDKFANFKGKRIGLVHMANMLGETDPCG